MLAYILSALVVSGTACVIFPESGFYRDWKLRSQWKALMVDKKVFNQSGKTFTIQTIKNPSNKRILFKLNIPAGLTIEDLEGIKKNIEYTLGGDVTIEWLKYQEEIEITVRKGPKDNVEIKSGWVDNKLEKHIQKKFGESFRIASAEEINNETYIIKMAIPAGLSMDTIQELENEIKDKLPKGIEIKANNGEKEIEIIFTQKKN